MTNYQVVKKALEEGQEIKHRHRVIRLYKGGLQSRRDTDFWEEDWRPLDWSEESLMQWCEGLSEDFVTRIYIKLLPNGKDIIGGN